ncbi:MAG: MerR family transcriptional regulator [Desulfuromonadales bacterium]|nr:MerR family transcriptional regulator [Desulfuromonadales bacterium]
MLLNESWCTVQEAVNKYGIDKSIILEWVDEGIIRTEEENGKVARINIDDLELAVQEYTGV